MDIMAHQNMSQRFHAITKTCNKYECTMDQELDSIASRNFQTQLTNQTVLRVINLCMYVCMHINRTILVMCIGASFLTGCLSMCHPY